MFGVTPPNVNTLSAAVSVADKTGTRLAISRPSSDDCDRPSGEVVHKVGLFRQVKSVFGLADLWAVRYRQGNRADEGILMINVPGTRFNSILGSGLGRSRRNANAGDVWTGVCT